MDKKKAFSIIQTAPYKDIVDFLLERCNLSAKELALVYARAKEGVSQEEYSEIIERSPRHVQALEDRAFQKIVKNWSQLEFLNHL